MKGQVAFVVVEVVGKVQACRPSVPYFTEHCQAAELAEAISGICEEVDFWVVLGVLGSTVGVSKVLVGGCVPRSGG